MDNKKINWQTQSAARQDGPRPESGRNQDLDPATFEKYRRLIYEKSGIALTPGKEALVAARVGKRMRELCLSDHDAYLRHLMEGAGDQEIIHLLDAIATNVTSFYREPEHFELLADILRQWRNAGQQRFRLWSAAAATGEEPYTIAITLLETFGPNTVDARLLATDISTKALTRSLQGAYSQERVAPIPRPLLARYFDRRGPRDAPEYAVKQTVKDLIVFRRLNLSTPPFPMHGPLDVVFCRNVMIYFDKWVRARLLEEIHRILRPGGYLFVGHAESLTGMMSPFKVVKPSVYRKI